jgi:outer membrane protein assembly factor BamB
MRTIARNFCARATQLLLLISVGGALSAADWPQFRGPKRDDICTETGLLKQWPDGGPPLLWKAHGLGKGFSTVSVVGDRIYTAGDLDGASMVEVLNAADGKPVWSAKLGRGGDVSGYEGTRGTPTVDGDLLFAIGQLGDIVCLETATGKEIWRKDFKKDFGGAQPNWGYAESPLVDGDKVGFTPGGSEGSIVALNKKTGALLWRSKEFADSPHYSSLIVAEIGGVRQYIQLTPVSVAGIAAADGKLLWRALRRGQTAVIPSPIYRDGFVYVTSGYGVGCNLFKIENSGGKFSVTEVFQNKVMVNQHGGVILVGDQLYGYSDGKGWTCQNFKTGEAVWQEKGKMGKGAIAYADGNFYLREEGKGSLALIEASPAGYTEHGRFEQPERSSQNAWPHPVIAGGKLYVRDQDLLLCYDVKAK